MVPGFQPVQEIYKVFILPFQIQLINLWDFHMDFIQVFQIVAYRKGRPFHRIRRTIGLDFIFQIFGWQRNNVIRLAILDVIIFCTPFCRVPSGLVPQTDPHKIVESLQVSGDRKERLREKCGADHPDSHNTQYSLIEEGGAAVLPDKWS